MKFNSENILFYCQLGIVFFTIATVLCGFGVYYFGKKTENEEIANNKPTISVKTSRTENKIRISLSVSNNNISALSIDYPIWGVVTSITDFNSITDVHTQQLDVVGNTTELSENNIELQLEKIKPSEQLEYEITFSKPKATPKELGMDILYFEEYINKYKLSFDWKYKGKNFSETEWHQTTDDSPTTKPTLEWKGISLSEITNTTTSKGTSESHLPRRSFK